MATIAIWFLQSFSFHLNLVEDASQSILGQLASLIAPVFQPLGFGDWRVATSLVGGFLAKESVVSTFSVLFGEGVALSDVLTTASSLSLMVFCLLYTPCVAAIAAIRRELGGRDALTVVVAQCAIAYVAAFLVYQVV